MPPPKPKNKALVTFQDVAVYFSVEEWQCLEEWQKELYRTVMEEIHTALISLGYAILNPDTLFRIKKESEAFRLNRCDSESKGVNVFLSTDWIRSATRETFFVYAISSAGVMYTLTRNCSMGDFDNCGCDDSRNGRIDSAELAPDILFRIKVDEESVVVDSDDAESNGSLCEPTVSHERLFQVKEEDLRFCDEQDARGEDFNSHLITIGEPSSSGNAIKRQFGDGIKNEEQFHMAETSAEGVSQVLGNYNGVYRYNRLKQKKSINLSQRKLTVTDATEEWHNRVESHAPRKHSEGHTMDKNGIRYRNFHSGLKLEPGSPDRERTFVPRHSLISHRNHIGFQRDKWMDDKNNLYIESLKMNPHTPSVQFSYRCIESENSSRTPANDQLIPGGGTLRDPVAQWTNSRNHNRGGGPQMQVYHEETKESENCGIHLSSQLKLHQKRVSRDAEYRSILYENKSHNGLYLEQSHLTDKGDYALNHRRENSLNSRSLPGLLQHYYTVESQRKFIDRQRSVSRKSAFAQNHITQNGGRLYKCTECDKSFFQKGQLTNHRKKHRVSLTHQCAVCGKRFPHSVALGIHRRIHMGIRPYKCTMCEKSFSQRSHVVRHQKIHTGERPYRCTECEKGFSQRSDLVIHFRTHTGEKPYPCNTCGRRFSVRSNLVKHERCHTQGKLLTVCL